MGRPAAWSGHDGSEPTRHPLKAARMLSPRRPSSVRRVSARLLIVAGETAASVQDLPPVIRRLIEEAKEIRVVAPALPSRMGWLASATDKATERADERLTVVLGQLDDLDADAQGRAGTDDPLLAFEDAVEEFGPDHIIIGLRAPPQAGWQERGLLEDVVERFGLPVTVFQVFAP